MFIVFTILFVGLCLGVISSFFKGAISLAGGGGMNEIDTSNNRNRTNVHKEGTLDVSQNQY